MSRNPEACRLTLGTLLQQEHELIKQFGSLLADEYRVITERDMACLERVIADKARLLDLLAGLEQQRAAIQQGAGFDADLAGTTNCLCWCDPQQQMAPLWQNLQALARICQRQNRKNQQLVDLCSRHAREALHLLRGEEPRQDTYQADGETDNRHSNRSLARA